ncbi:Hypothetical protein, putative [Bodo saltans]|uniref:Uncharacterized protein n=1 Tax=Bodo saltans TaxID=75058 RepID=A0A0S4IKM3_BODSA|nr:Hypothetical protein, putative [Bodo saltans]|eukprot:CUE64487.1 Hypothetical protein, putative [Bodo saltans]
MWRCGLSFRSAVVIPSVAIRSSSASAAFVAGDDTPRGTPSSSPQSVASARAALIDAIMQRDKEIFTLKRQHELSMLRVEQSQNRTLKDQTDRGLYFEQNCNVHTFDTISVGLYGQRNTMYHTLMVNRLRQLKIGMTFTVTGIIWAWLYNKYMLSDEWLYIAEPVHFMGATTNILREEKARREEEVERRAFMEKHTKAPAA